MDQLDEAAAADVRRLTSQGELDMRISALRDLLEARVLCGGDRLEEEISTVFASDMMSDVLACPDEIHCLLTGLINQQVIRTADMMDIGLVVFVRGKCPSDEVVEMARQPGHGSHEYTMSDVQCLRPDV